MPTQTFIEKLSTSTGGGDIGSLSRPASNVSRFYSTIDGTITDLNIYAPNVGIGGTWIFNFFVNGVAQFSGASRMSISFGSTHATKTGLSIAVSKGDILSFDLQVAGAGTVFAPIQFDVSIDDGAGGGSGGFYVPDRLPTSPHAKNDEFNGVSLDPSWLTYGAADLTVSLVDSLAKLSRLSNTNGFSAIGKTIPSGDWDFVTKMFIPQNPVVGSGAVQGGVILFEDIADTSKKFFVNASYVQIGNTFGRAGLYLFTDRTTFGSTISSFVTKSDADATAYAAQYLRLQKVGTTYYSYISSDGFVWVLISTGQTFGFTPLHVGLWVDNTTGVNRAVYYDFARFYTTFPEYIGGS